MPLIGPRFDRSQLLVLRLSTLTMHALRWGANTPLLALLALLASTGARRSLS